MDFYQDVPWSPAQGNQKNEMSISWPVISHFVSYPDFSLDEIKNSFFITGKLKNECKKCNCNEHTDKCHFDSRVFAVS